MSRTRKVSIFDYRVGNIGSVQQLFKDLGCSTRVTDQTSDLTSSDTVVLPGVGSAVALKEFLASPVSIEVISALQAKGTQIVGLCVGAQILFDKLAEAECSGLGILHGEVVKIRQEGFVNTGWRNLNWDSLERFGLTRGLRPSDCFFFNHEYQMVCNGVETVQSEKPTVTAIAKSENVWAIQFHPEKSQHAGRRFMQNLLKLG